MFVVFIGLIGAGIGFALGHAIARHYGPPMFELPVKMLKPMWNYMLWSLIAAPVLAVLASALPAMVAVSGFAISSGFRGGPWACSASVLTRPSQKRPPTQIPSSGSTCRGGTKAA